MGLSGQIVPSPTPLAGQQSVTTMYFVGADLVGGVAAGLVEHKINC